VVVGSAGRNIIKRRCVSWHSGDIATALRNGGTRYSSPFKRAGSWRQRGRVALCGERLHYATGTIMVTKQLNMKRIFARTYYSLAIARVYKVVSSRRLSGAGHVRLCCCVLPENMLMENRRKEADVCRTAFGYSSALFCGCGLWMP